jgi:hypothetical protein
MISTLMSPCMLYKTNSGISLLTTSPAINTSSVGPSGRSDRKPGAVS